MALSPENTAGLHLHPGALWLGLTALIVVSCFFSVAETAYMSINRYRLRHMVREGNATARRAAELLERPDRLLGLILLGDTFADIFASAIATLLAVHYFGAAGIFIATIALTFIVLIFGEVAPKTLAALYPTPVVMRSAFLLWLLLKICYPLIWLINILSNGLLYLFGVRSAQKPIEIVTAEELRTVVTETGPSISAGHQQMLLQLIDLEKVRVEDIMIPRQEIRGIDLSRDWPEILEQLTTGQHTRLPVYHEHLDNIAGILHVRLALNLLAQEKLNKSSLKAHIEKPYFIPETTTLTTQLLQFCQKKSRAGLVVNEYGDILGLITMEDILEEIVGEFTTDTAAVVSKDILPEANGHSYIIDGSITLRALNKALKINFPLDGPKTLSGLITEYLEMLPPANICVRIAGYRLEILQVKNNRIRTVRLI